MSLNEMETAYFLRDREKALFCFYISEDGLVRRSYEKNEWGEPRLLCGGIRGEFSVNLSHDRKIYIFCQDENGDLRLVTNKDNKFTNQVILKSQSSITNRIKFNALICKEGFNLLYNVPMPNDQEFLMSQKMNPDGGWDTPTRLDRIVNFPNQIFHVQNTSPEHMLVFYQTKNPDYSLCYREITREKIGRSIEFHRQNNPITDFSALTTRDSVHVLYITKGLFSSQLVYRRKDDEFTPPMILWEGQRLENCLLMIIKHRLYAFFMNNGSLLYCLADGKLERFSRPARYNERMGFLRKAVLITEESEETAEFFAREVYTDLLNPWDVKILPDFCTSFYPPPNAMDVKVGNVSTVKAASLPEKPSESEVVRSVLKPEQDERLMRANEKIELLNRQISEKDSKIFSLARMIKEKNEQINQLLKDLEWEKMNKNQEDEVEVPEVNGDMEEIEIQKEKPEEIKEEVKEEVQDETEYGEIEDEEN